MAGNVRRALYELVVTRLPWTIGSHELEQYFSKFGQVRMGRVLFDHQTGFSKSVGFISFTQATSIQAALQHGAHILDGSRVDVRLQKDGESTAAGRNLRVSDIFEAKREHIE